MDDILETLPTNSNKHLKNTSSAHESRQKERATEKAKAKPRLTLESLRQIKYDFLPSVINPDPDYHYMWLSKDPKAQPNFHDATTRLGYTPCTTVEMPEMSPYVHLGALDKSITNNEIIVKEMILCKILNEDYQTIMELNHHVLPAEQEGDIYERFEGNRRSSGFDNLNRRVKFRGQDDDQDTDPIVSRGMGRSSYRIGNGGVVTKVKPPIFK